MPMKPNIKKDTEIRTVELKNVETRAAFDGKGTIISGLAVVYEEFAEIHDTWGDTFYEKIDPKALNDTLADGHRIFALKDHDWGRILGHTDANLKLENRSEGLYFELTPNKSSLGQDVLEDSKTHVITGCSFGFKVNDSGQEWEERDGSYFRTLTSLTLNEITLTSIPYYESTSVEVRSLVPNQDDKKEQPKIEQEERNAILAEANKIYESLKN
ncbi:HK97 family phage prohead protease [Bacillus wiedmannii]|uniref:HK97 family phage prohead protease n=1 Tax=Bacillus wiedmannii TaxID=1890302 RepID=UPI0025A233A9|nr:HK97 family phage prohead protease [Bacillus wiedmannii]MDM5270535.1 HK97 family phage prohead protease [Bacillus wiedmannii]